jgi:hypothetical protein
MHYLHKCIFFNSFYNEKWQCINYAIILHYIIYVSSPYINILYSKVKVKLSMYLN